MEGNTVPDNEDSENSVVEIEIPKKPTPPLIEIEEDEIILNIKKENQQIILAKNIIEKDLILPGESPSVQSEMSLSRPSHWTVDMIKFYDDDWGGEEEFIVEKIQAKMNKAPSLWQISKKDYLYMRNKSFKFDIKCTNCFHYGHHFSTCPEPPHVTKCFMCGNEGHSNNICPYSKCLNCGKPTKKYTITCFKCKSQMNQKCSRCHLVGHNYIDCSDHWRLFHLTTNSVSVVVPDKNLHKLEKDMWCCNCGDKGHYQTVCLQVKNVKFRDTYPFVVSYKKAFQFTQYKDKSYGNPGKKFFPKRHEDKMELSKINELNRAMKIKKCNISQYNFKRFHKLKKHNRKRWY